MKKEKTKQIYTRYARLNRIKGNLIPSRLEIWSKKQPIKWKCKFCYMQTELKGKYHWESECSKNSNRKLRIIQDI